jgi:hypothetical protein
LVLEGCIGPDRAFNAGSVNSALLN